MVKSKRAKYTRGHHPASHSDKRNKKARKQLKKLFYEGKIKRYYGKDNVSNRPDVRKKISKALKGKKKTEETKRKMRIAARHRPPRSKEAIQNAAEKNRGQKRSKKFCQEQSRRTTKIRKKKKWDPWNKGKKGLQVSWNKGLTKKTDKRVAAGAKKLVGRPGHNGDHKWLYQCGTKVIWMRSSWEVRYAEYLDKKKIKWLYESKVFYVGESKKWNGETYCPDFFLSKTKEYVEVKGPWLFGAKEKLKKFKKLYPRVTLKILEKDQLNKMGVFDAQS